VSKETVYRLSFLDVALIIVTQGWWAVYVYCFKGVEVDEPRP
jgi:hypothetical protein